MLISQTPVLSKGGYDCGGVCVSMIRPSNQSQDPKIPVHRTLRDLERIQKWIQVVNSSRFEPLPGVKLRSVQAVQWHRDRRTQLLCDAIETLRMHAEIQDPIEGREIPDGISIIQPQMQWLGGQ
jgi:hypothetical protein